MNTSQKTLQKLLRSVEVVEVSPDVCLFPPVTNPISVYSFLLISQEKPQLFDREEFLPLDPTQELIFPPELIVSHHALFRAVNLLSALFREGAGQNQTPQKTNLNEHTVSHFFRSLHSI